MTSFNFETGSWHSTQIAATGIPAVRSYLSSKGWQQDGSWRGASVWRLGERARLLVPDRLEFDDANQLIEEAVAKIARYEGRPEYDVWRDIAEPLVDAQFFRLHPDAPSGSIPLPAGVKAADGILSLLSAAATMIEHGGGPVLIEGRRTQRVNAFLHQVLLGSAVPGSYILTARVPAVPVGAQELDIFDDAVAFSGRSITKQLCTALDAARAAALRVISGGELDTFYDAAQDGVSPNLCRALADLGGEKRDRPFEIGFTWARGVPGIEPVPEIAFTNSMPAILIRASEELSALARRGTARISGIITDLHDEPSDPARIKIKGELQTPGQGRFPRRAIWIALRRDDYDRAIDAHQRGRHVQVNGRLTTSGRLELTADSFEILPR